MRNLILQLVLRDKEAREKRENRVNKRLERRKENESGKKRLNEFFSKTKPIFALIIILYECFFFLER